MQIGQHPVRLMMILLAGLAAFLVLGAILLDEGEIVTLETVDDAGRVHETQLWVAYLDRTPYLRAGTPESTWLERVRVQPEVDVDIWGGVKRFRATLQEDPAVRERLNRVMAQKYGLADDIWGFVSDRRESVPIRLERIDGEIDTEIDTEIGTEIDTEIDAREEAPRSSHGRPGGARPAAPRGSR